MSESSSRSDAPREDAQGGMKLTFGLAAGKFGIDVAAVREIIGIPPIVPVPRTPEFIRGVMEVRGEVLPVLDLRVLLGTPVGESRGDERVVVVETGTREMGMIVDEVFEVTRIEEEEISPAPDFGTVVNTECVLGLAKTQSGVVTLLDLHWVLDGEQAAAIEAAKGASITELAEERS
jgi:purine-binding chemotaxis protein CheW